MADETQRGPKVEESSGEAYSGQHEDEDLLGVEESQKVINNYYFQHKYTTSSMDN